MGNHYKTLLLDGYLLLLLDG